VGYVLRRAGILQDRQKWVSFQYPGLCKVTGKLDFIAGGKPDYDKAIQLISSEFSWLPEFISRATQRIVIKLKEQYPNGLKNIVLEIKSCSSFMFERYERNKKAELKHILQDFHYLKAENMDEGHVVYVSKDDARLAEFPVFNPSETEAIYHNDIEAITGYLKSKENPPLENLIVFDGNFSLNFKVTYSNYLEMLYGFKTQKDFEDRYKPMVEKWNRVIERMSKDKKITNNNKEAINEIIGFGFNFEEIKNNIEKGKIKNEA
jgi:hypothetical protein